MAAPVTGSSRTRLRPRGLFGLASVVALLLAAAARADGASPPADRLPSLERALQLACIRHEPCGDLDSVIKQTDDLLDAAPSSADAYHLLGQALKVSGEACGGSLVSRHATTARRQLRWLVFSSVDAAEELVDPAEIEAIERELTKKKKPRLDLARADTPEGTVRLLELAAVLNDDRTFGSLLSPANVARPLFNAGVDGSNAQCAGYSGSASLTMCLLQAWFLDAPFDVHCEATEPRRSLCTVKSGSERSRCSLEKKGGRWLIDSVEKAGE